MRLVALSRVSTTTQARDGDGLDAQDARIRDWARHHKHKIVAWCRDEGISGAAPLADRAGLVKALGILTAEKADGIVVASLDRLSRDLVVQEQLYAEVTGMGCVLRSVQPGEDHALVHDEADPSRALVRRILASIHAYERDMIRLRLRNGAARKAERGGYTSGRPPYGWAAIGRELVAVPGEQAIRTKVKAWRREGWSLQAIADKLNADGIPSQTGIRWSKVTVNSVAKNTRRASPGPLKKKAG